jgi:hypothetical protein
MAQQPQAAGSDCISTPPHRIQLLPRVPSRGELRRQERNVKKRVPAVGHTRAKKCVLLCASADLHARASRKCATTPSRPLQQLAEHRCSRGAHCPAGRDDCYRRLSLSNAHARNFGAARPVTMQKKTTHTQSAGWSGDGAHSPHCSLVYAPMHLYMSKQSWEIRLRFGLRLEELLTFSGGDPMARERAEERNARVGTQNQTLKIKKSCGIRIMRHTRTNFATLCDFTV